jgi:hypothetical protein
MLDQTWVNSPARADGPQSSYLGVYRSENSAGVSHSQGLHEMLSATCPTNEVDICVKT